MTDQNYTAIAVVVDRSGSMQRIREDAQGALDSFLKDQKEQPSRASLMYTLFDTAVDVGELKDIQEVDQIPLHPRGMTALYDAVGQTITVLGERLVNLKEDERPGTVIVAIVTDGFNNASHEFTAESVKKLIETQTNDYGWDFVFLAAGQDAALTGGNMGIASHNTLTFANTGVGYTSANAALSSYTTTRRSGKSANLS